MRATCLLFGRQLDDVGTYALPWSDLLALIQWAPPDSPIMRAMHPEVAQFASVLHTNTILADHADVLLWANYQRVGGRGQKPKPYPRPGDRATQKFGKRKMTRAQIVEWVARRRQGLAA